MEEIGLKTKSPSVRVIILNYNQSQYTIDTVNYISKQDYENFHIVIVDNCSNEEEIVLLEKLLPKSVTLLRSDSNIGYARGNNIGCRFLSNSTVDYYLILNNDVIINEKELISKLIQSFINFKKEKVIAISPLINTISTNIPLENQIQVRKILPIYKQIIVNSPFLNKLFYGIFNDYIYKSDMPYIGKEIVVDSINGAAFIIDGHFFRNLNFLDEGTFLFFEEIILGKQIQIKGFTCLLNGNVVVEHLQGVSTKSNAKFFNLFMEKEKLKSELFYFKKYFSMNSFALSLIKLTRLIEIYILKFIKEI